MYSFLEFILKCRFFTFSCDLGELGDKSMETIVLAETKEVAITTLKFPTLSCIKEEKEKF
jgi:hypothetical protein